eukprot:5359574-Amphidinium_carterae.1
MLSGRYTVVCADDDESAEDIVEECCGRLGMERSGKEALVHGTEVLPAGAHVRSWPGLRPAGERVPARRGNAQAQSSGAARALTVI